jgi:phosphoribosylformylglycinamidine synthase subunit PurQ / glutaminase
MKFGVVQFPGSNCDFDCYYAINIMKIPVEWIWHKQQNVDDFDCIFLPGGFTYGDYLRVGAIARHSPIMQAVINFARKGGLVVGICNGFQVLTEARLLPGTLIRNEYLHFICKQQTIRVENTNTPFTKLFQKSQVLRIPIAHGEGCYYTDTETLQKLEKNNQVIFRYCDVNGSISGQSNPNGSLSNIAGICNKERNVLGLMPHPERAIEDCLGSSDGRLIFESIIEHIRKKNNLSDMTKQV